MNALARWFGRTEHDGAAAALEVSATGLPAAILEPEVPDVNSRRRRLFEPTQRAMLDAVGKKVLHGWLQNRHQTLLPLTVNFRTLPENDARLLAEFTAAAVLAGSAAGPDDQAKAVAFLKSAGSSDEMLKVFARGLTAPAPLYRLLDQTRRRPNLGPLAYILLVVVHGPHDPANAIFLQWAAAKLDLPTTVVRSVERRYRH